MCDTEIDLEELYTDNALSLKECLSVIISLVLSYAHHVINHLTSDGYSRIFNMISFK